MINIDVLVAGCHTRCKHCYVNGGPGPWMPLEDALLCIEKLDILAQYLPDEVTFTLDHEPMAHPDIVQILDATTHTRWIQNYHHGMTTGVGLIHRKDKRAVIEAYMNGGYRSFGITIHGSPAHHDEMVRRKGAYESAIAAAEYLKAQGADVEVSLMLNRYFTQDQASMTAMLETLQPNCVAFVIPIFTPHRHMLDFEPYRASIETVQSLRGAWEEWRQDGEQVEGRARQNTIAAGIERLRSMTDLKELFVQPQEEQYFTLHQDCQLYVGNSGAETRCLGDLRHINLEQTAELIKALPGNRDYGAFYDLEALPSRDMLIRALEGLPQHMIYGDFESVIYRGLEELRTPTRILE